MVKSFDSPTRTLWLQVWGLAGLVGAIIFSWMIYSVYQQKILQKLDFVELAGWLGIIQGLLATIIEPFVGRFSDRIQQRLGNRLFIITVGVTLASLSFVILSLLIGENWHQGRRWLVPMLMSVWVISIILFRSPAIALLTQFTPVSELPQASAVLVFIFGFVSAIWPLLKHFINDISVSLAFLLGAIALVMGGYILRSLTPVHTWKPDFVNEDVPANAPNLLLILIFVVGLGVGLELNLLMSIFPQELQAQFPGVRLQFITSGIFFVCAIASVIFGEWTAQIGANKAMLLGLGGMTGLMGLALLNDINTLVVAYIGGFGISLSLICVSMIPFCLAKVPQHQAGLAIGLYFSGTAGATTLVAILIKQSILISLGAFLLAEFAFFVVAGCIVIIKKI
jgi:MFS family permease